MVAVTQIGGRKWELADALTGAAGKDNLNSAVAGGVVSSNESKGLFFDVSPMGYLDHLFVAHTYPGTTDFPIAANGVYCVYIDNAGNIQVAANFPGAGFYVALAIVSTSLTQVLQIVNIQQISPMTGASAGVDGVTGTAPITVDNTDPANPVIEIDPASGVAPGSMSAADFTKLAGVEALADVTDAANVAAAGAFMKSALTAIGQLISASAVGVPALINPGAMGTFLMSMGVGALPAWNAIATFASQVWIGNPTAVIADPLGGGFNVYQLSEFSKIGDIAIQGTSRVRAVQAGTYVGFLLVKLSASGTGYAHTIELHAPSGTIPAKANYNPGPTGLYDIQFILPFYFVSAGNTDVFFKVLNGAIFGASPGAENIIVMFKISN